MKNTKIILSEDVYNLGEEGDVCEVAPGYARNYLIPKGFAVPYSRKFVAMFKDRKTAIENRKDEKRNSALGLKERLESMAFTFEVPAGDSGKLFGSVTNATVADRLLQDGLQIERKKIELPGHTIKMVGEFDVIVKLYADETATLKVTVVPEGGAAKPVERAKKPEAPKAEVASADDDATEPETASDTVAVVEESENAQADVEAASEESIVDSPDVEVESTEDAPADDADDEAVAQESE